MLHTSKLEPPLPNFISDLNRKGPCSIDGRDIDEELFSLVVESSELIKYKLK